MTCTSREFTEEIIKPGYVRVSQVLHPFQDFSQIPPDVLANKARIGTEVHAAIEAFYKKEFFPVRDDAFAYLCAFKNAYDRELKEYEPVMLERRFYNEEIRLTGRVDLIARKDGVLHLIDFKTTASEHLAAWKLQLALYVLLAEEDPDINIEEATILQLKKNGKYKMHSFHIYDDLLEMARYAVALHWHFHK